MSRDTKKIPENSEPDFQRLIESLKRHEGFRAYLYDDATGKKIDLSPVCKGNATIGIGLNISAGIDPELAGAIAWCVCHQRHEKLTQFDWYRWLSPARKEVIIEMSYQMGVGYATKGILGFRKMIASISRRDIPGAGQELLDSVAARNHPLRYQTLHQKWVSG